MVRSEIAEERFQLERVAGERNNAHERTNYFSVLSKTLLNGYSEVLILDRILYYRKA